MLDAGALRAYLADLGRGILVVKASGTREDWQSLGVPKARIIEDAQTVVIPQIYGIAIREWVQARLIEEHGQTCPREDLRDTFRTRFDEAMAAMGVRVPQSVGG